MYFYGNNLIAPNFCCLRRFKQIIVRFHLRKCSRLHYNTCFRLMDNVLIHCRDVTLASWRLNSPVTRLFVQRLFETCIKYKRSVSLVLCDGGSTITGGFSQKSVIWKTLSTLWSHHVLKTVWVVRLNGYQHLIRCAVIEEKLTCPIISRRIEALENMAKKCGTKIPAQKKHIAKVGINNPSDKNKIL